MRHERFRGKNQILHATYVFIVNQFSGYKKSVYFTSSDQHEIANSYIFFTMIRPEWEFFFKYGREIYFII